MKRRLLYLSAALLSLAAGCSIEDPAFQRLEEQEVIIRATIAGDDSQSRSVRLENGDIWWTPGDQISVFYGSGTDGGSCFTSQATENSRVTNFTGTIGVITGGGEVSLDQTWFWGLYPYNETAECDGSTVVTDVPSNQVAMAGTFAPGTYPWIGKSQGLMMTFYGLCGGIKFTVNKEGIKRATLKTLDGSSISGRVRIAVDANGIPTVEEVIDGSDEVVLEAPSGEYFVPGQYYFFVTLPHNFSESYFTVKFETFTEEGTYERKRALEIKRADFIAFSSALDGSVTYEKKTGPIPIEDEAFKSWLTSNGFDTDGDGEISYEEAEVVRKIDITSDGNQIQSLGGIEFFTSLDSLRLYTGLIRSANFYVDEKDGETIEDVLTEMRDFGINDYNTSPRGLTSMLDLSNNKNLKYLNLRGHPMLQGIDVSSNSELEYLSCYASMRTGISLDVSKNSKLESLICSSCFLTGSLDLTNCSSLTYVDLRGNAFSELKIGELPNLKTLAVSSPALQSLDLSGCPNLKTFHYHCCQIESLDVSYCPELTRLVCSGPLGTGGNDRTYIPHGHLKSLDLSHNPKLEYLDCNACNIEGTLDLTGCPNLTNVIAYYNEIDELRLGNHPDLTELYLAGCWHLTSLDLSGCPSLSWISTYACDELAGIDFTYCPLLETCYAPTAGSNFSNNQALKFIEGGTEFYDQLQYLTGLEEIRTGNFSLLDLSYNTNLKRVTIWNTEDQAEVNLSKLVNLEYLDIASYANIEVLDISNNLNLTSFTANGCPALNTLYVAEGQEIDGITVNRSDEKINPSTQIIVRPAAGGGEGSTETPEEP